MTLWDAYLNSSDENAKKSWNVYHSRTKKRILKDYNHLYYTDPNIDSYLDNLLVVSLHDYDNLVKVYVKEP